MMIQLLILSCLAGPLSTPGARSTTDSESEKRQMPRLEKWSAESPAAYGPKWNIKLLGGRDQVITVFLRLCRGVSNTMRTKGAAQKCGQFFLEGFF